MKNGLSKIILFIIILLLVLLCGVGYCYLKTDIFKTPDELFKKYLSKNVNQIVSSNSDVLSNVVKRMSEEEFEDNLKIKVNLEKIIGEENLDSFDEEELEQIKDGYSIDFVLKSDPNNSKSELNTSIKYGEYESTLKSYISQEQLGLQLDEINNKYLVVKNEKLKDLFKKFGVDEKTLEEIPDKIISDIDYDESAEKVKNLEEKYTKRLLEQISEDKYKIEKKVSVNYNNQNYIANKYTLSLTDKEASNIVLTTIKELVDDPDFLSLVPEDESDEFKNHKRI